MRDLPDRLSCRNPFRRNRGIESSDRRERSECSREFPKKNYHEIIFSHYFINIKKNYSNKWITASQIWESAVGHNWLR